MTARSPRRAALSVDAGSQSAASGDAGIRARKGCPARVRIRFIARTSSARVTIRPASNALRASGTRAARARSNSRPPSGVSAPVPAAQSRTSLEVGIRPFTVRRSVSAVTRNPATPAASASCAYGTRPRLAFNHCMRASSSASTVRGPSR